MARCKLCKENFSVISKSLGVCLQCIRENPNLAVPISIEAHKTSKQAFNLPETQPNNPDGILCRVCVNECRIPKGNLGYCGLRKNEDGRFINPSPNEGKLSWYYDPLPTNCVADWVCPGGTGCGYPKYSNTKGPEYKYKNLAVFFKACTFDCLFCQNWHYRKETLKSEALDISDFVTAVDERTSCICYFGGDPTPQLPFAIKASKIAISNRKGKILRICWETNGSMNTRLLDQMMKLSLESGGCIKFDLKAWDENLHVALTGVTNKRTLKNFAHAANMIKERPVPPPLVASTLLVPGYVDESEIRNLAKYIASINPNIPYTLLGFYPNYFMSDLPCTSRQLAEKCFLAAREEGLINVEVGNVHLLI